MPRIPQNDIEQSKVSCIHEVLYAPILVRVVPRPAISKILHIVKFPIDYHVKRPEKNKKVKKKKKKNIELSNFTIPLTNLVGILPRNMHEFWLMNIMVCSFRGDVV